MNIRTRLKPGDVVNIYTDYQDEDINTYEGKAILIEKIRDGDSFYRGEEQITVPEKKQYSKNERLKLEKYTRIKSFFKGTSVPPDKEIVKLRKELVSARKDDLDDIENMTRIINTYKVKYKDSVKKIKTLLTEFDDDYIIRYIQQDRDKWNPSIYSYERWLVKFTEDKTGWQTNFTTQRNIRFLVKLNPNEHTKSADIRKYTTYNNGISSLKMFKLDDEYENDDYIEQENEIQDIFDEYENQIDNEN